MDTGRPRYALTWMEDSWDCTGSSLVELDQHKVVHHPPVTDSSPTSPPSISHPHIFHSQTHQLFTSRQPSPHPSSAPSPIIHASLTYHLRISHLSIHHPPVIHWSSSLPPPHHISITGPSSTSYDMRPRVEREPPHAQAVHPYWQGGLREVRAWSYCSWGCCSWGYCS